LKDRTVRCDKNKEDKKDKERRKKRRERGTMKEELVRLTGRK